MFKEREEKRKQSITVLKQKENRNFKSRNIYLCKFINTKYINR